MVTVADLPSLEDLPDPDGKRVLLRADMNVPLRGTPSGAMEVADDFRIQSLLPTLSWLVGRGAQVTVCSHLGRPKGHVVPELSMDPVRRRLLELVPGVEVMENLRFDPGEEANDPAFVDRLVEDQDLYVDDAFGAAHRAHASIVGPPGRLPSAAGRLLAREVAAFSRLIEAPARPFVAVVGGAKLAGKLGLLEVLSSKVDTLLVGGGMCFTFLAALGHEVGDSLVDPDHLESCRRLVRSGHQTVLPIDVVALGPGGTLGPAGPRTGEVRHFGRDLLAGWRGVDLGSETVAGFAKEIDRGATVLWNGPMGVVEDVRFTAGTWGVADALARCQGFTVAGGGDTVAALRTWGMTERIDHVSTGGGATLELVEKGDLPGLAALRADWVGGPRSADSHPGTSHGIRKRQS